jgi:excisionase family DNA binding protein
MEKQTPPAPQPLAYSVSALASDTSLSKQTIYAEIEAGRLRAKRIRNRIVIPRDAVDEWLKAAG